MGVERTKRRGQPVWKTAGLSEDYVFLPLNTAILLLWLLCGFARTITCARSWLRAGVGVGDRSLSPRIYSRFSTRCRL